MAVNIEVGDGAFGLQLKTFANKLGTYATTLGILPAEVTSIKADALAFEYLISMQATYQSFGQTVTAYKNLLRKGGELTLGPLPVAPVLPAAPPMPQGNIEARFRSLVQRITHNPAYTTAIGEDLGIEGSADVKKLATGKPVFKIEFTSGGHPDLIWVKGKYQGVEIWKDSGTGFVKLDRDMSPGYVDKSPLPAAGMTALWKYKMIYLIKDEPVGAWSDTVNVTVYGEV